MDIPFKERIIPIVIAKNIMRIVYQIQTGLAAKEGAAEANLRLAKQAKAGGGVAEAMLRLAKEREAWLEFRAKERVRSGGAGATERTKGAVAGYGEETPSSDNAHIFPV